MTLFYIYSFFFNATATTEIYTLSLHDALPIFEAEQWHGLDPRSMLGVPTSYSHTPRQEEGMPFPKIAAVATATPPHRFTQSELLTLAGYRDEERSGFFRRSDIEGR